MASRNGVGTSVIAFFNVFVAPDWMITCAAGGVIVLAGLIFLHLETRARCWRKCVGVVTRSDVKKVPYVFNGVRSTATLPDMEYEYVVDGETYHGQDRSFSNFTLGDPLSASEILSKYKVGQQVTVFCNPKKPSRAVLEFGIGPGSIVCLCLGALVLTIGLCSR